MSWPGVGDGLLTADHCFATTDRRLWIFANKMQNWTMDVAGVL